jgi:hypothetical protein
VRLDATPWLLAADIDELYDYVMDDLNKRINLNCKWSKKIANIRKANRMEIT